MNNGILACSALCIVSLLMSACSPMNTEFSCNATASDSCMTIEQVDAMTRFADSGSNEKTYQQGEARYKAAPRQGAKVWLSQQPMK